MKISYAKTVYGEKEINAVVECLKQGTQMGKYTREFEKKVSCLLAKKEGVFVNSGSSALYIGIESFSFPKGSEIITPGLTFSTTVGCIVKAGLIPVFLDVGIRDYCIDCSQIESVITNKTVAILAPNLLGNICRWDIIKKIAQKYNLIIIEDSADTLGATLNGKSSGYWSDASITSFYGSHIINCAGNGGMLCLNGSNEIREAKLLRSWGRSSSIFNEYSENIENRFNVKVDDVEYDAKFVFERIGYNVEGSEIGAAFGLAQLESLEKNIQTREKFFSLQTEFFNQYPEFFITPLQTPNTRTGWLAYPILLSHKAPFSRREFQLYLEKEDIQTRVIFTGNITRQPGFKSIEKRIHPNGLPNADYIMKYGVLLACHHGLNQEMMDYMHERISNFIKKF